jgi:hypothetical protein
MARITIKVGDASWFADEINAEGMKIAQNSFAADTLQFTIPRSIDAAKLFSDGSTIEILLGSTRIFIGSVRATPVAASAMSERHIVNASGGWWWLEKHTFEQLHRRYLNGTRQDVLVSSVVLGRTAAGNALMTCGAVIKEAIDFATARAALIQAGTISAGPSFPEEDALDLTCAEMVLRVCRWMPDLVSGFDHSTGRLNLTSTPTSTVSIDAASTTYRVQLVDPAPRTDLLVPGVRVDYQITATVNGKNVLSIVRETAGNPEAIGGVKHTMNIRGGSLSRMQQTQHIKVETLPENANVNWWKAHCADLADARITNLALSDPAAVNVFGANELVEGTVQEWMLADVEGSSYSLHAGETTFTVKATYDLTVDSKVVHVTDRIYTVKVTTTDATSRSYSRMTSSLGGGEYYPTGLAAALYAAGSRIWWDGTITIMGAEIQPGIIPGMAVNVTGARAEWATMAARIVAVTHDIDAGVTSIRVGPPRQLTLGDLADQLRRNRRRNVPISTSSRLNPDIDDASDLPQVRNGSQGVRKHPSAGLALLGTEQYIITGIKFDPASYELQVTKRKGFVVWSEENSGWALVDGWDTIDCSSVTP